MLCGINDPLDRCEVIFDEDNDSAEEEKDDNEEEDVSEGQWPFRWPWHGFYTFLKAHCTVQEILQYFAINIFFN